MATFTIKTVDFKIPTWALCPLEYGDYSGITDHEELLVNEFTEAVGEIARDTAMDCGLKLTSWHWSHGQDEYFHWTNDIQRGMGGDIVDSELVLMLHDGEPVMAAHDPEF